MASGTRTGIQIAVGWSLAKTFGLTTCVATWLFGIRPPPPPAPETRLARPKVAIIGAGISGVTVAAHCIGHGFDVRIFEAGPQDELGGIWTTFETSSNLRVHAVAYGFQPYSEPDGCPGRRDITNKVTQMWHDYGLEAKTIFDHRVARAYRDGDKWIIDSPTHGTFDGIITTVGSCGKPKEISFVGESDFSGQICHYSDLPLDIKGKILVIVGDGAEAVECINDAIEKGVGRITLITREGMLRIPRNAIGSLLLLLRDDGFLPFLPASWANKIFYRTVANLIGCKDQAGKTVLGVDVLHRLRLLEIVERVVRGDVQRLTRGAVVVNCRSSDVPPDGPHQESTIQADVVAVATGHDRSSMAFLPSKCFKAPFLMPDWFTQVFPPRHPSVAAINCTYLEPVRWRGNWHIAIFTRMLLVFLLDPSSRPSARLMSALVSMTQILRRYSPIGAFDTLAYFHALVWLNGFLLVRPWLWRWALFVVFGWRAVLPCRFDDLAELSDEDERTTVSPYQSVSPSTVAMAREASDGDTAVSAPPFEKLLREDVPSMASLRFSQVRRQGRRQGKKDELHAMWGKGVKLRRVQSQ